MLAPYVGEELKRRRLAPRLEIDFRLAPPWCHRTKWSTGEPVYYFRFTVTNHGRSQAQRCEAAVLTDLWVYDSSGNADKLANFSPVSLKWSGIAPQGNFQDINPRRPPYYCDIGHVSSERHQRATETQMAIDVPGHGGDVLRFFFEMPTFFFSQPNCLAPGRYAIKVGVYSENAKKVERCFDISWSGTWQDGETEMFREIVIEPVKEPAATA